MGVPKPRPASWRRGVTGGHWAERVVERTKGRPLRAGFAGGMVQETAVLQARLPCSTLDRGPRPPVDPPGPASGPVTWRERGNDGTRYWGGDKMDKVCCARPPPNLPLAGGGTGWWV